MKFTRTILILFCFLLGSCTVTKPLTSAVLPIEVQDLRLLEPYSYISIISKGNRQQLDDSTSFISKQLVFNVIDSFKRQLPLTGEIILSDTSINKSLEKEYEYLVLTADKNKSLANLRITPTLDKVLEANDTRFGLIIICTGFTRAKGNYGKQIVKGAALALLTLGAYYQTPIKANSTFYAMIVDSKDDNIAFYRKSFLQDGEPLDQSVLTKQCKKLFDGYFWSSR